MADVEEHAERFKFSKRANYNITTTLPDEVLRHDISDEELAMLCKPNRESFREGMWAALGTFGGALPSGVVGLVTYFSGKDGGKVALVDFIQIIILAVSFALSVVMLVIVWNSSPHEKPLETKIRERTKRIAGEGS